MEDRLDDAIHVLRNHAEAGFPSSTPSAIPGDPQIPPFHSSYAPPPTNPMSDSALNGCTVMMLDVAFFITNTANTLHYRSFWLQDISDPCCQTPCLWL